MGRTAVGRTEWEERSGEEGLREGGCGENGVGSELGILGGYRVSPNGIRPGGSDPAVTVLAAKAAIHDKPQQARCCG